MIWFQFSDEAHGVRDHGERAREREQLACLALMKPYIASSTVIKCINKQGGSDGSVGKRSYCTSLAGWVWHPEITQYPHTGRWRALTPQSSPLTFTHKVWYVHTSTHTQIKQYLIKKWVENQVEMRPASLIKSSYFRYHSSMIPSLGIQKQCQSEVEIWNQTPRTQQTNAFWKSHKNIQK